MMQSSKQGRACCLMVGCLRRPEVVCWCRLVHVSVDPPWVRLTYASGIWRKTRSCIVSRCAMYFCC